MKKIFVVDDELDITRLIKNFFELKKEKNGDSFYEIVTFSSGNDCIDSIKKGNIPDTILSDVRMANGSGIDLIQFVMSNASTRHIPFFFMTGFSGSYDADNLISLGAKKVYAKPFKCRDVEKDICSITEEKKAS